MIEVLITFLLIAGLNFPVFIELYKHILRNKSLLLQIIIIVAYWAVAFTTQTMAAFISIIYLYAAYYRKTEPDETFREVDIWHISAVAVIVVIALSIFARIFIGAANYAYVVALDKILHYPIKPQDIVTYYTQTKLWLRGFLAVEIVLIAPMVEEFVFRFFLYDKFLAEKMPKYTAAIISAGLFTLLHFNVAGIPTFFGLGLWCVLMYEKKGYWGAVIAHGVANAIALFYL